MGYPSYILSSELLFQLPLDRRLLSSFSGFFAVMFFREAVYNHWNHNETFVIYHTIAVLFHIVTQKIEIVKKIVHISRMERLLLQANLTPVSQRRTDCALPQVRQKEPNKKPRRSVVLVCLTPTISNLNTMAKFLSIRLQYRQAEALTQDKF